MSDWQRIDTAPKNGRFIAWNELTGQYITERNAKGEFPMNGWGGMTGMWYPAPTHWMPLPSPPLDT